MIDDREINALAKGMVPFVRDCVAEAVTRATVPPELAAEVAAAVRLLHEAPLIERAIAPPPSPPLPRVSRIERDDDGNFVPVYDEPVP
jgi:hypothetical protein